MMTIEDVKVHTPPRSKKIKITYLSIKKKFNGLK